jgi:hypothetical protein
MALHSNQMHSMALHSNQMHSMAALHRNRPHSIRIEPSIAFRGHQRQSEVIKGTLSSSVRPVLTVSAGGPGGGADDVSHPVGDVKLYAVPASVWFAICMLVQQLHQKPQQQSSHALVPGS